MCKLSGKVAVVTDGNSGKAGLPPEAVDGYKAHMATQVPLGRIGSVDEIAKPALFLASSAGAFVTGVELAVDGGLAQI